MCARILQALKREDPTPILASAGRLAAVKSHSTVQQEDHTRKEAVKKLTFQFETHPNREALNADFRQN